MNLITNILIVLLLIATPIFTSFMAYLDGSFEVMDAIFIIACTCTVFLIVARPLMVMVQKDISAYAPDRQERILKAQQMTLEIMSAHLLHAGIVTNQGLALFNIRKHTLMPMTNDTSPLEFMHCEKFYLQAIRSARKANELGIFESITLHKIIGDGKVFSLPTLTAHQMMAHLKNTPNLSKILKNIKRVRPFDAPV